MNDLEKDMKKFGEISKRYPSEIAKAKNEGAKVVCWYGSYVPEEPILASGAKPYILADGGGDPIPAEAALPYVLFCINVQARHQIGIYELGMNPVIDQADHIFADTKECDGVRVADYFEFKGLPVTKLGVPQSWQSDVSYNYYKDQLTKMKATLEKITGNEITEQKLSEAIVKVNKIRELLEKINATRKDPSPAIGGEDFIKLNHYAFKSNPDVAVDYLQKVLEDIKDADPKFPDDAQRIVMAGRGCMIGDYTVIKLLEESGAVVVNQLFDEGIRHLEKVKESGDPLGSIAEAYFKRRTHSALFNPSFRERWEAVSKQIDDYNANGLLYYQLAFDVIYDYEWPLFAKWAEGKGVPFQEVESGYDLSREATGPLRTRIESFVGVCRGGK